MSNYGGPMVYHPGSGGANLWPWWFQDHPDLKKKIYIYIYNNSKFYICLPIKNLLGPP